MHEFGAGISINPNNSLDLANSIVGISENSGSYNYGLFLHSFTRSKNMRVYAQIIDKCVKRYNELGT